MWKSKNHKAITLSGPPNFFQCVSYDFKALLIVTEMKFATKSYAWLRKKGQNNYFYMSCFKMFSLGKMISKQH